MNNDCDHDYEFDSDIGWPVCLLCGQEAPPDYYDGGSPDDDDYGDWD